MYTLKKNNFFFFFLFLLIFFTSCATGSRRHEASLDNEDIFAPLAQGASLYLYIDVPKARTILDSITLPGMEDMDRRELNQMFDRTSSAVAAFYPEGSERRFLAAAQGSYPSRRANMAFTFNRDWKRQRSQTGSTYWRSDRNNLSLSLSAKRAFVSDGDPFISPPELRSPEDFDSFREQAVLAGWAPDAAHPVNRYLSSLDLPIQIPAGKMFFAVYPSNNQYEAKFKLETPSATHARALAAIISMARIFMSAMPANDQNILLRALFANPPLQDGSYLNMQSGVLSADEIALLFNTLSVYSR